MGFIDSGYAPEPRELPPYGSSGGCVEFTFSERVLLSMLLNEEVARVEFQLEQRGTTCAVVERLKSKLGQLHCMLRGVDGSLG